jgi:hypothetical protein
MASQWLGNTIDKIGTAFKLPEWGISERLAGGNPTTFTGYTPQSQQAGLDTWRQYHFNQGTGSQVGSQNASYTNNTGGQVLGTSTSGLLSGGNQGGSNPFQDTSNAERGSNNALLSSLNTQYDRLAEEIRSQLPYLENQYTNARGRLGDELTAVKNKVGQSRMETEETRDSNIAQAGDTARQTQLRNRNMLRGLGILNSSAAGDILARPMEQFDSERANQVTLATKRLNELDTFLAEKTAEHSRMVGELENNYLKLVGDIQRDLRFNERERADAIQAANSALESRLSEIRMAQMNYENQVNAMKQNFALGLAEMSGYQLPQAQMQGILASVFNPQQQGYTSGNAQVLDERRKYESGLLSAL